MQAGIINRYLFNQSFNQNRIQIIGARFCLVYIQVACNIDREMYIFLWTWIYGQQKNRNQTFFSMIEEKKGTNEVDSLWFVLLLKFKCKKIQREVILHERAIFPNDGSCWIYLRSLHLKFMHENLRKRHLIQVTWII